MTAARAVLRDERAVVMVEFLISFCPVLVLFLGLLQLALLSAADLVVRHAAVLAARAAAVVLTDDPRYYADAGVGEIGEDDNRTQRFLDIEAAARAPLLALGPGETTLELPTAPGSETLHAGTVPTGDTITVRVRHVYRCRIPLASALLCDRSLALPFATRELRAEAQAPSQHAHYRYAAPEDP